MAEETIDILYEDFNINLYKLSAPTAEKDEMPSAVSPSSIQSGTLSGNFEVEGGYVQSYGFISGSRGWRLNSDGNLEANDGTFRGDLVIGGLSRTIDSSDDIQTAITALSAAGGGTLYLKSGTWTVSSAITGSSSVAIIGISPSETFIDFNSTAANLVYTGTSVYSTGTVTVAVGTAITGSGTSWLANVTPGVSHLFIGTRWYLIATATSDTTLILAEAYGDTVTLPSAYRISTVKQNVTIKNLMLKNSTGTALAVTDGRRFTLDNVLFLDNNKGYVLTNVSETNFERILSVSNTSNGIELTNVGLSDWESVNSIGNGGHGYVLNNVKTVQMAPCLASGNTSDGWNMTTCVDAKGTMDSIGNGGQGIEMVATNSNVIIRDATISGNTSDGIKLTATSDYCKLVGNHIAGNGGWGINIAAASDDLNLVDQNSFAGNSSGTLTDSGTGTITGSNPGI